jgi:hypothetical protein
LELAKNKGLDNDDSNGRCLGWRCLAWVRCQNHKDMIHTMFGGNRNGNDSGWTALSKVSLLSGAANFLGGLPVLKHSVVKIAEFLHSQHSNKLTDLQLPRPDQALRFSHVDEICAKIEFLDVCRDDLIPGQSQCIMCLCFNVGLTKFYALLQVIGCSNLSLADFMRWMRNCQGFM